MLPESWREEERNGTDLDDADEAEHLDGRDDKAEDGKDPACEPWKGESADDG